MTGGTNWCVLSSRDLHNYLTPELRKSQMDIFFDNYECPLFYKSPYNQHTNEERMELMQDALDIINNTELRFIYHVVFLNLKDFCTSLIIEEFGPSGNNRSRGQKITSLLIITREIFYIYNLWENNKISMSEFVADCYNFLYGFKLDWDGFLNISTEHLSSKVSSGFDALLENSEFNLNIHVYLIRLVLIWIHLKI